jgi:tetratricopeptide (TPR) repeat protein
LIIHQLNNLTGDREMKGLKVTSAIVLLSFVAISSRVNAQTVLGASMQSQIGKSLVASTPNSSSQQNEQEANSIFETGRQLYKANKYSEAIQAFSKFIELQPNNKDGYFFRGVSYQKSRQYQEAKVDFDKVIELDSSLSYAYFVRGIIHNQLGEKEKAIADLQIAVSFFKKEGKTDFEQKALDLIKEIQNS